MPFKGPITMQFIYNFINKSAEIKFPLARYVTVLIEGSAF